MVTANIRKFLTLVITYVLLLQCYDQMSASAQPLRIQGLDDPFSSPPDSYVPGGNGFTKP